MKLVNLLYNKKLSGDAWQQSVQRNDQRAVSGGICSVRECGLDTSSGRTRSCSSVLKTFVGVECIGHISADSIEC